MIHNLIVYLVHKWDWANKVDNVLMKRSTLYMRWRIKNDAKWLRRIADTVKDTR